MDASVLSLDEEHRSGSKMRDEDNREGLDANRDVHELLVLFMEHRRQGVGTPSTFEIEVAAEICSLLEKDSKFDILESFLLKLPYIREYQSHEGILRARIALAINKKDTTTAKALLTWNAFEFSEDLIRRWDQAHYIDEERRIGKNLSPLARFRVRKRNPPPRSICANGMRKTASLPKYATKVLRNWLDVNYRDPYPTLEDKHTLAKVTGLTVTQVKTWFANARRRMYRRQRVSKARGNASTLDGTTTPPGDGMDDTKATPLLAYSPLTTTKDTKSTPLGSTHHVANVSTNSLADSGYGDDPFLASGSKSYGDYYGSMGTTPADAMAVRSAAKRACPNYTNSPLMDSNNNSMVPLSHFCDPPTQSVYEAGPYWNPGVVYQQRMPTRTAAHSHFMAYDPQGTPAMAVASDYVTPYMTSQRHALCFDTPWVHGVDDGLAKQQIYYHQQQQQQHLYQGQQQQQQQQQLVIKGELGEWAYAPVAVVTTAAGNKDDRADMDAARILADLSQKCNTVAVHHHHQQLRAAVMEHFPA